ncbi:hypothetical protein [Alloyangia pacifica]|uniref:hypothetical protein n=1 Tax=Alloyangia pacifica TaxID=311180 RepID=UPI001CFE1BF3|nr:hypothetical protein [Alloyangia pacifica]
MTRLRTIPLLLIAGMASAESVPTTDDDLTNLGYISAARPGTYAAIPPSANGFPDTILANMRMKLGGERTLPEEPGAAHDQPKATGDGH